MMRYIFLPPPCHPELVSGSGEYKHEILKQVQDDRRLRKYCHLIFLHFFLLCTACSSPQSIENTISIPINNMLTEQDFREAVTDYLYKGGGPAVSTYDIVMTDLNGDHSPEGLVMMNTPFKTWCKATGCTLLIFEEKQRKISLHSRIEPIRGPLFLHDTEGTWKSIVTRQYGLNRDPRYIELQNEGTGYPAFTLNALDYQGHDPHAGASYFYSD